MGEISEAMLDGDMTSDGEWVGGGRGYPRPYGDESTAESRRLRHAGWKIKNMKALTASRIPFKETNGGESILFRDPGKPKVDFYPSTGRWRDVSNNKTHSGGGAKFIAWYQTQKIQPKEGT